MYGKLVRSQNLTKTQDWKKVSLNLSSWYNYGKFREEPDLECCKTQHNELDRQPDFCFQSV